MKKATTFGIIFCSFFTLFGQDKIELIDIDAIWNETRSYQSENDLKNALAAVKRIPSHDSTYLSSLTSKAYYHTNLGEYDEAIQTADEGLKINNGELNYYFYVNKIAAQIGKKSYSDALNTIDIALVEFPKNYKLYYNKGVAYEGLEDYEKASQMYQTAITYNPFYAHSHLKLAIICYKHHLISQTMMCLNMYLLLNPDGDDSFDILNAYNNMVKSKNTEDKLTGRISPDDEGFEEIDLIINNYAALNKKYKISNKINLPMIKQNHAMMSQLNDFEGNGGFWDRYYVPFHKYILENGLFDAFTYTISYSVENEKLKTIVDKNVSTIKDFIPNYRGHLLEIFSDWQIERDNKQENVMYLFIDSKLSGIGQIRNSNAYGYWEIFNDEGRLTSYGDFNENNERHGHWKWYDDNGNLSEETEYENGKLTNEYRSYFENGKTKVIGQFSNGERNGPYKKFNEYGALIESANYKDGLYDGELITYYPLGENYVKYRVPYTEGKVEGTVRFYFENGNIKRELNFKNDEREGKTISYFINGEIETIEEFSAGVAVNTYTENHINGKRYKEGSFEEGEYSGVWKIYFMDGTLNSETTYKKGFKEGPYAHYDRDGKLHYEYTYKKGEIIAYKFYDKQGAVITEAKKQGGAFLYKGHSPNGKLTSQGTYNISGGKVGDWKFYSDNGVLEVEEKLNDDAQIFKSTKYYDNGKVESITNYDRDTLDGYYVAYRKNGNIQQQGWYLKGDAVGHWINYYQDGTIESDIYYSNGKKYGTASYNAPDGKLAVEYVYDDGELMKETYFNDEGTVVEEIDIAVDSSEYLLINRYVNGKVFNSFTMLHNIKNGPYTSNYFNGAKRIKGAYLNGNEHGKWEWYHENEKLKITGEYVMGKKHGVWKEFHENGKLSEETTFLYGIQTGEETSYNDQGIKIGSREFKYNQLHGRVVFYSEDGKLQITRYYDHGRLIGYGHKDKSGKDIPMIPIENETGKLVGYFDNGKIAREMEYKNGSFVNAYKEYYYTGQLFEEQFYNDNLREGALKRYYPNGTLKAEMVYSSGDLHGVYKQYYSNGKLKEETNYLNDYKHGVSKFYNSTGKLIKERVYFDDEIISEINY